VLHGILVTIVQICAGILVAIWFILRGWGKAIEEKERQDKRGY
jgi:hypothetical protein